MHNAHLSALAAAACVAPDRTGRVDALRRLPAIRLAALGGSITFGYTPSGFVSPYPRLLSEALSAARSPDSCTLCNLGISGTDARLGLYLTDRFLKPFAPDCVIVEYAVNQGASPQEAYAYESLLCKLLLLPTKPAVVTLMCAMRDGFSSETYMREMAVYYGLPVVSIRPLLAGCPWTDYSADTVHPHADGHQLLADCLLHLLQTKSPSTAAIPVQPLFGTPFRALRMIPLTNGTGGCAVLQPYYSIFEEAPAIVLDATHPVYTCTVTCATICVIFMQDKTAEISDATLQLDTDTPTQLAAKSLCGWGNPTIVTATADHASAATHTLRLRLSNPSGRFTIWGIGELPAVL